MAPRGAEPGADREAPAVRQAGAGDLRAIGRLLHDFNREFDEPTPSPAALERRMAQLLEAGDTVVLLVGDGGDGGDGDDGRDGGDGPDGLAVLRFRMAIWSDGLECYLAELYVVPHRRGQGLGRALMDAALQIARERGADTMDIGVDEPDHVARHLYESLGFSNHVDGADGPVMYVYERDLSSEDPPLGSLP